MISTEPAIPKMIDYIWNPWTRATATEEQKRDKVKVE